MVADMSAAGMERMADEYGTFTMIYWRRNPDGLVVRDAKFIEDARTYQIALILFADFVAGNEVGLCAVLRGKVATVDDIERADEPEMDHAAYEYLETLRRAASFQELDQYTVFGSWDTGDGHKRYMKVVEAVGALHAEMLVRADKTEGVFLVAAVVKGCVPTEDSEEIWATLGGQPLAPAEPPRPWWKVWRR